MYISSHTCCVVIRLAVPSVLPTVMWYYSFCHSLPTARGQWQMNCWKMSFWATRSRLVVQAVSITYHWCPPRQADSYHRTCQPVGCRNKSLFDVGNCCIGMHILEHAPSQFVFLHVNQLMWHHWLHRNIYYYINNFTCSYCVCMVSWTLCMGCQYGFVLTSLSWVFPLNIWLKHMELQ